MSQPIGIYIDSVFNFGFDKKNKRLPIFANLY